MARRTLCGKFRAVLFGDRGGEEWGQNVGYVSFFGFVCLYCCDFIILLACKVMLYLFCLFCICLDGIFVKL